MKCGEDEGGYNGARKSVGYEREKVLGRYVERRMLSPGIARGGVHQDGADAWYDGDHRRALRVPPTTAGVVPFWLTLLTSCFDTMPMPLYGGAGLVSGLMMPSRLCSAGPGFRRRVRSGCDDRLLKLIRQH